MLTDQQLEAAAKRLCELRGASPNQIATCDGSALRYGTPTCPLWKVAREELIRAQQINEALEFGAAHTPPRAAYNGFRHGDTITTERGVEYFNAIINEWQDTPLEPIK